MNQFLINLVRFIFFGMLVMQAQNAYAYIDPGTGSYVLQILIASVVSGLFVIKMWWAKIKSFIFKGKSEKTNENQR
jgi:hypothetical protein